MKYIKHNNSYIRVKSGKAFLFSFIDKPTEYELPSIPKNPIYISKEEYEYGISQKISNKNPKYKLDEMKDKIVYNLLEYSDKLNEISDFFDSEIIHTLKILRKDSTTKPKKYYKKWQIQK